MPDTLLVQQEKDDPELIALETITRAMDPLDDAARIRVLRYVSRFLIQVGVSR